LTVPLGCNGVGLEKRGGVEKVKRPGFYQLPNTGAANSCQLPSLFLPPIRISFCWFPFSAKLAINESIAFFWEIDHLPAAITRPSQ